LAGDWRIFQPRKGHRWSLDDLATAWVALDCAPHAQSFTGVDLGTGLGSVLMLLAWAEPAASFIGLEAQATRAARARRSLRYNGAVARCRVLDGDLRTAISELEHALPRGVALVTGTPPYFPPGAARAAEDAEAAACRIEQRGGLEVYLDVARKLVSETGNIVLCYPPTHTERSRAAALDLGLALRERCSVIPKRGKPALLVVERFCLTGGSTHERELVVRDERDQWTDEFRALRRRFGMPDRTGS
jgi:tRNA1(Val) A37 N6-methylase TrmN6